MYVLFDCTKKILTTCLQLYLQFVPVKAPQHVNAVKPAVASLSDVRTVVLTSTCASQPFSRLQTNSDLDQQEFAMDEGINDAPFPPLQTILKNIEILPHQTQAR